MFTREIDPLIPSGITDVDSPSLISNQFDPGHRPKLGAIIFLSVFVTIILSSFSEKLFQIVSYTSIEQEFDYIVVGAGPAGIIVAMTLANKLLKEANELGGQRGKVLLIESGTRSQSTVEEVLRIINKGGTGNVSARLNEFDIPLAWSMLSKAPQKQNDRDYFLSHQWISESINFL